MGLLNNIFGRRQYNDDEERRGTKIIFPERVMALVLLVRKGLPAPVTERARQDFVWRIFRLVNPALYASLPDKGQINAHYYESGDIEANGHIDPNGFGYLDPLDYFNIPNMASTYIQTLKLTQGRITIILREDKHPERSFAIGLDEPILKDENAVLPEDATLMTIHASNTPKIISSLWPALPLYMQGSKA